MARPFQSQHGVRDGSSSPIGDRCVMSHSHGSAAARSTHSVFCYCSRTKRFGDSYISPWPHYLSAASKTFKYVCKQLLASCRRVFARVPRPPVWRDDDVCIMLRPHSADKQTLYQQSGATVIRFLVQIGNEYPIMEEGALCNIEQMIETFTCAHHAHVHLHADIQVSVILQFAMPSRYCSVKWRIMSQLCQRNRAKYNIYALHSIILLMLAKLFLRK